MSSDSTVLSDIQLHKLKVIITVVAVLYKFKEMLNEGFFDELPEPLRSISIIGCLSPVCIMLTVEFGLPGTDTRDKVDKILVDIIQKSGTMPEIKKGEENDQQE